MMIRERLIVPSWQALEMVLNTEHCEQYMFMGIIHFNDDIIYCYKHLITRQYLNLDAQGRCYCYRSEHDDYVLMTADEQQATLEKHREDCQIECPC